MHMWKFMWLMGLIPVTMILMVSFFVLLGASKAESKGLKSWGMIVSVLLWICAATVFVGSIAASAGRGPMGMWKDKMMMMEHMGKSGMMDKDMMDKMKTMMQENNKAGTPAKK
jgi:hypothetical protein